MKRYVEIVNTDQVVENIIHSLDEKILVQNVLWSTYEGPWREDYQQEQTDSWGTLLIKVLVKR